MPIRGFLLLVFLFSQTTSVYGQIVTYQLDLKDSTADIIHTKIANHIYIKNLPRDAKVEFNKEVLTPLNPSIDPHKHGNYVLRVIEGGENTLRIYKNEREIYKHKYIVKSANEPVVRLGIIKDSIAAKEDILFAPRLSCFIPNCDINSIMYRLVSYSITLYIGNNIESVSKEENTKDLNGIDFDDHVKNEIRRMKKGDKIIIDNIKVLGRGDNFCLRQMTPIKIIIK